MEIDNSRADIERGKVQALHPEGLPELDWENFVLDLSDVGEFLTSVRQEQIYALEPQSEVINMADYRSLECILVLKLRFAHRSLVRFVNSFR
jgi:hypothetical protein